MNVDWIGKSRDLKLRVRNFVAGRYTEERGEAIEKYSPRDGSLLCQFGAGEEHEVEEVVAVAKEAFDDGRWSKLPMSQRKDALYKLASLMEAHAEELALLECLDVGKPISDVLRFDVPASISIVRFNAEAVDKVFGKVFGSDQTSLTYQLRRPMGVVAAIIGWNFPLVLAATKLGPALAAGNTVVLKPSELTSLSAARVAELAVEAGIPSGVFNVIHGRGAIGAALARHAGVDLMTFTGSTQTGKKLLVASGESNMKRLILECGGKASSIVFDDGPDLEAVADAVAARAFWNQGEVCTASSRVLVHGRIKDKFLPLLIARAASLAPMDPLNPASKFGALVSAEHQQKVLRYIERGRQEGAEAIYESRATAPFEKGFYVAPVVFDAVKTTHAIAREEIFGPVVSVMSFCDEAEAIGIANSTIYGLSAIVWTQDMGRAHRMAQQVKAGWIVVNASGKPVGHSGSAISMGGLKESGIGVEGGIEGIEAYTSQTAVQYFV
jgi:acyl-CoA reductase-like NAD-dependent aldehyde dehydrogenase